MNQTIVLETPRLRLRPLTSNPADVAEFVRMHADPRVNTFVGAYTEQQAVDRLRIVEQQWAQRGHGLFAVESREDGRFLGRSGLQYWEQWDEVEAAWTYRFEAHGHGYATEAAEAFLAWGWRTLGMDRITSLIDPRNAASAKVAERLGFRAGALEQRFEPARDMIVYELRRSGVRVA